MRFAVLFLGLLLLLAGCGSSADSIRVNGLEGVEVSVSESVDGDGVHHAVIEWEEG